MHRTIAVLLAVALFPESDCLTPLFGAPVVPPRAPLAPAPKEAPEPGAGAKKIDPSKSGAYRSGPWKYQLTVRSPGTRSESKWGRLYHADKELTAEGINDYYATPWGPIYWTGNPSSRWGEHLWMPHPALRSPDRKGKRLDPPGDGTGPPSLGKADSGRTVTVAVGATILVKLAGNPTTGYQWRTAKLTGDAVKQQGKPAYEARQHPPGMVGVGGTYTFKFEAVKPGSAALTLHYVRPWEKGKPPAETFQVKIVVAKTQEAGKTGPAKERDAGAS